MHGRASPSTPSTTAVLVVRKPLPPPSLLNRFASALFHTVAYSIAWSVCLLFERRPGASSAAVMADEPVPAPRMIDAALVARGQARYSIFCAPCHADSGDGEGMIVQRGFPHPPSFHLSRFVHARAQVFYDAITYGHGAMYSYAARVPPPDRWAIAAYIRALQLSQATPMAMLTPQDRAQMGPPLKDTASP